MSWGLIARPAPGGVGLVPGSVDLERQREAPPSLGALFLLSDQAGSRGHHLAQGRRFTQAAAVAPKRPETETLPEPLSPSPPLKLGLKSQHPPQVPSHGSDDLTVSGFLDHLDNKTAHSEVQTQTSHSAPMHPQPTLTQATSPTA